MCAASNSLTLTAETRQRYARCVNGPSSQDRHAQVSEAPDRQARRASVTRLVYGLYMLGVAVFVVSSILQVGGALFGTGARADSAKAVAPACGRLLEEQSRAIELARVAASAEPSAEAARARYAAERQPGRALTGEIDRTCAEDPRGKDALAALARFDRAAESHAVKTAAELSPVRLASQSFIRGDLP